MADEPTGTPDAPTGTPAPAGGGSGSGGAVGSGIEETPEQLRERLAEAERIHQQDLSRLNAGEQATRRAQELEAENELLRQRPTYQPPTGMDPQVQQFQQDFADLSERDPAAARLIVKMGQMSEQAQQATRRDLAYSREMEQVPAADRDEVARRCKATPGLFPAWAQKDLESEKWRRENAALDERRRKLDEEEAARRRGRVDTSITPVSGADLHNAGMTASELAELSRKADAGDSKALQRLRDFDDGKLGRLKEA